MSTFKIRKSHQLTKPGKKNPFKIVQMKESCSIHKGDNDSLWDLLFKPLLCSSLLIPYNYPSGKRCGPWTSC